MFKLYNNHHEAESLIDIMKPLFSYSEYTETRYSGFNNYTSKKYTAICKDAWEVTVNFLANKKDGPNKKKFYPKITFRKKLKTMGNQYSKSDVENSVQNCYSERVENSQNLAIFEIIEKSKQIADLLQSAYNPDFDRILNIIDIFIDQGLASGMFAKVDRKKYEKHISSHIHINPYLKEVSLWSKNHSAVVFNNILQKGVGTNKQHFKKSFISIGVEYLVDSLGDVKPYFKLSLPITAHNKQTYCIPLTGEDKMYLVGNEDSLTSTPIDNIVSIPLSDIKITEYFKEQFNESIKKAISTILNIKKTELDVMNASQLKEYFIIIEMLKV